MTEVQSRSAAHMPHAPVHTRERDAPQPTVKRASTAGERRDRRIGTDHARHHAIHELYRCLQLCTGMGYKTRRSTHDGDATGLERSGRREVVTHDPAFAIGYPRGLRAVRRVGQDRTAVCRADDIDHHGCTTALYCIVHACHSHELFIVPALDASAMPPHRAYAHHTDGGSTSSSSAASLPVGQA